MYSRYRAIACNSQGTLDALVGWLPTTRARTRVIPNGVPLERFQHATPARRDALGIPLDAPVVAFVARFQPAKDHATLIRAAAQLPGLHLLFPGDGELRSEAEALARSLGVASRTHFLGRRADIPELLKMSDVYVHSSHWEGFGIAAVEAMAAGLPIIATDVPGLSEVVGGAGPLFPVGDVGALVKHLRDVLSSAQRRKELAQAGKKRAQEFSIERSVDEYVAMYKQVIAERH